MDAKSYIKKKSQPYKTLVYHRLYIPLLCKYLNVTEKKYPPNNKAFNIPPPRLRYRVGNRPEAKIFLEVGKNIAEDIERALGKVSLEVDSFDKILDFGCGCGRTIIWFANRKPDLYGTDVDSEAIAWCQNNLKFAKFDFNKPFPPLSYPNDTFSFIYSISVFTHLDEDFQFKWMEELNRILKKGGVLLVTFHGRDLWKNLLPQDLAEFRKKGFVYKIRNDKKGVLPEWYQTAYHTKEYVLDAFGRKFKFLGYYENGIKGAKNFQDVALFEKS